MKTEIGAQIDRLAEVNKMLLDQANQTCLDYKYDKMIKTMQNTSWESDQANGGKKIFVEFYRINLINVTNSIIIYCSLFTNRHSMDISNM